MGICVHCMQPKPIAANKCPHCLERTGVVESRWWSSLHEVFKWIVIIVGISMLYRCAVVEAAVIPEPVTVQEVAQ